MDQEMNERLSNIQDEIADIIYDLEEMERAFEEEEIEEGAEFNQVEEALSDMYQILDILRCYTW